jgi:hypothetical protein
MSLAGILIGLINCIILAVILVLVGAIIQWVLAALNWPVPAQIVKLYLAIVALVTLLCFIMLLLGMPMVHVIHVGAIAISSTA